jgi:hypothetical protein
MSSSGGRKVRESLTVAEIKSELSSLGVAVPQTKEKKQVFDLLI